VYTALYPVARSKAGRGDRKWRDRLGLAADGIAADLWLHASSVGEVKVLAHLLEYLWKKEPGLTACVTVMTDAGYKTAARQFGDRVTLRYLPLDARPVVARMLTAVSPRALVIAETEIWPNLISEAYGREVPVIMVNGRMTDRSFKQYRLVRSFMKNMLTKYARIFFKTEADADRYRRLGLAADSGQVTGDMKFDAPMYRRSAGRREEIRYRLGAVADEFVLVAGSTRVGEETQLLDALTTLQATGDRYRLVIAPRHVERAEEVKQACLDAGVRYAVYGTPDPAATVVLVDRMGLLMDLYAAADAAFVGGTLVDIGGHNILEPVWTGTPVFYGPSLSNVHEADLFIRANNFGMRVSDIHGLTAAIIGLRSGEETFAVKSDNDVEHSATGIAGDYILEKLGHGNR